MDCASRRTLRMATLASSARLLTIRINSLRRSWLRSGRVNRIVLPFTCGLMPRSDCWIALITALEASGKNGSILMLRVFSTDTNAMLLTGNVSVLPPMSTSAGSRSTNAVDA